MSWSLPISGLPKALSSCTLRSAGQGFILASNVPLLLGFCLALGFAWFLSAGLYCIIPFFIPWKDVVSPKPIFLLTCVSKLSTSKFFWRSQVILLSQTLLPSTSSHCNIHISESVPLPWAVLFQLCHDSWQCLTWACSCKTHCKKQINETQNGRKKWSKNPLPASPKQKWGRTELLFLQEGKWEVTACTLRCGSAHLCGTEKIENTGVLRDRLNFLDCRAGYCTEIVIRP